MNFVVTGRRKGKTTGLLEWAQAAPEGEARVIVSHDNRTAMALLREAREKQLPLESWQFVGIDEVTPDAWSGVIHGRGDRIVLGIDNLDLIIRHFFRGAWSVDVVTATGELGWPDAMSGKGER